jgi:hypothetical protein
MVTCPKCGKAIEEKTTVCECGAILFGQVTNVLNGWETETVFRAAKLAKKNWLPTIFALALVVGTALLLAWPTIRENIDKPDDQQQLSEATVNKYPTQSDLIPTDDLLQTETSANVESPVGAFEFITDRTATPTAYRLNAARQPDAVLATEPIETANSLDAQLLSEPAGGKLQKTSDAKNPADCTPEITASLKLPDSDSVATETKSQTKSRAYMQGPRGGCFFVTASGGKKYVDRALCASATTAAARQ